MTCVAACTASHCLNAGLAGVQLRRCWRNLSISAFANHGMITCDPPAFRANLGAHVAAMPSLGFNAHALAVLAARYPYAVLGSPDALAAHYAMLREVFHPWGTGLRKI